MISLLKGILEEKLADAVVLDCGGVGYYIKVPGSTLADLPETGQVAQLYITIIISKTDARLIGFSDAAQKECFQLLNSVPGCGTKHSLSILSYFRPTQVYQAIKSQDSSAIAKIRGVGKKLSQRIVLELETKVNSTDQEMPAESYGVSNPENEIAAAALVALCSLGFKGKEIEAIFAKNGVEDTVESTIKAVLQQIGK